MVALLAALPLGACGGGPGPAETAGTEPPRHVFLLTVDTLRADHLSAYGYPRATSPRLDRLAGSGVLFERAIAQWPKTGTSFASMFTGRYPQSTGLLHKAALTIPEEYLTLPELFDAAGFTNIAVVSNPVLAAKLGWDAGFDEFGETWGGGEFPQDPHAFRPLVHAGRVNELALALLERHKGAERLFVWLHYSDPHAPYILPDGAGNPFERDAHYVPGEVVGRKKARGYALGDRRELGFYVSQYDANVLVVDAAIGEVLDRARELGLLDDALVVFTADHGESLGEHGSYFEHGPLPYNTTAQVPLFLVQDGAIPAGRRVGRPVELVDLYPTLRDLVLPGREVPGLEGQSLVPFLRLGEPTGDETAPFRVAFSEAGERPKHFRSVQDGAWKLVYDPQARAAPDRPGGLELYHLESDPGETTNLATEKTDEVRRLRRELLGWMKTADEIPGAGAEDEEAQKALRALGYVN